MMEFFGRPRYILDLDHTFGITNAFWIRKLLFFSIECQSYFLRIDYIYTHP
jgi:hypothetical protein